MTRRKAKKDSLSGAKGYIDSIEKAMQLTADLQLKNMQRQAESEDATLTEQQTKILKNVVSAAKETLSLVRGVSDSGDGDSKADRLSVVFTSGEDYAR